jgi:predicted phage gp36 major capsid-like protein
MGTHDFTQAAAIQGAIHLDGEVASITEQARERLHASRERIRKARHDIGFEAGQHWATNNAEFDELDRVANSIMNPADFLDPDLLAYAL